ncbi:MAG: proline--tRNA ligase, partial [Propionibacteriales bacterium]|nr:proline--tRNA ligase [Propionibacteriales bacterium]
RDEARPRAGILRGREFIMKDAYSFDVDDAGLEANYQRHREAYRRIFDRLGFEYVIVQAMSGSMGGSASEEFLAVSTNGEDTYVRSPGGYAANVEAVTVLVPDDLPYEDAPVAHAEQTPDSATIDTLVAAANELHPRSDRAWTGADTLKNVLFMITPPGGEPKALAIGLPGDREVDAKRLEAQIGEEVAIEPFTDEDFARHPQLVKGYIGPGVLGAESVTKIKYLVDPRVVTGTRWVTGADADGQHVFDLVCGRDFTPDGTIEVAEVRAGDPAPDGSGPLELARGIEMGHIFQLGRKFADALGLKVLDQNGKLVTVTMGSYGVGVSRAVAAVAEYSCDEKGLAWPRQLAPFDVQLVAAGKDPALLEKATQIAGELSDRGVNVLFDDRKASPGVKFADAEIMGMPTTVVLGKRLAEGLAEVRDRASGAASDVSIDDLVDQVTAVVRSNA